MAKLIYTNGDSWTAGDIVDPELFGDNFAKVNDPENRQYRLPRVWPHKLGKLLNSKVINNSHAGGSNDRIVRSTINDIIGLLNNQNKAKDLFVIIGWSSPERKDFYYKWDKNAEGGEWECLYPAELKHWKSESDELNDFFKLYVLNHWYEEEFITRHALNTITLHNFLKNLGIKHLFFNAFYEEKEQVLNEDAHQLFDPNELQQYIIEFENKINKKTLERLEIDNIIKHYHEIYKDNFVNKSFIKFLLENKKYKQEELIDYHPTELGHQLWAEFLQNKINEKL